MNLYNLSVASSCLLLIACARAPHYTSAVSAPPNSCVFSELQKPMQIQFGEFEKQISAFDASHASLDILVVIIRPGRADNELKRLIVSATGASLLAVKHNIQDSIYFKGSLADTITLGIDATGYYQVDSGSPFAHEPTVCTLVKRYGRTSYTSDVTSSDLSCLTDSTRRKIQPGVNIARWLLPLH